MLLLRIVNPAYGILWIGLVGLPLRVFTEHAPHFHRIPGAAAPVALLAAVRMDRLVRGRRERAESGFPVGVAVGVILIMPEPTLNPAYELFYRWAALPDLFHALTPVYGNWP
ncbi:MAG: hypothetical protein IPK16_34135 [Anaerolineales bacterium]|nr:hypothetical protein [Anaerolineales bacterium]